jgi:mono/diheme cytochrome c family protein
MAGRMVKKLVKLAAVAAVVIIILLAAGITFTIGWRPFIGARSRGLTARKVSTNPMLIGRGKYLVESVTGCFDCHSPKEWDSRGAPPVAGKEGSGRQWTEEGLAWLTAPNITPDPETGAGKWTDDQFARAIREGIGHDGRALFPIMPYSKYKDMSDEDLDAIIAYIKFIPAINNPLPKTSIPFPMSRLILGAPQPITAPVPTPVLSDPVKKGQYLVTMASCAECHTAQKNGQRIAGLEYAGGFQLKGKGSECVSVNITPDPSGIPYYDENLFIEAIRTGRVKARDLNAAMPWVVYRGMGDEDLKAIFAYVKTFKPVHHYVDNHEPPTMCRLCGLKHGLGDKN